MSFKAIAAAYGMIGAVAAASVATHYAFDAGDGGTGRGADTAAADLPVRPPPPTPLGEREWYAAVLPFDGRIHMPVGPEDRGMPIITWHRSREEVARVVEEAARVTGNPEIVRLAREKRQLADL